MKTPLLLSFILLSAILFSQTNISGIVNEYASIQDINYCEGKISLENPISLQSGDFALIFQMKGATINESNSSDFGDIIDYGGAGLYEKVEIINVQNTDVFIKHYLIHQYDITGFVQLVSIPKYENAVVADTLKGEKWDGKKGGVIALQVENTLRLNAPIDASEIGFRGGQVNVLDSDCGFFTNANNYWYDLSNWRGAPKGEGIAEIIQGKESGRGAQANGGGGGNDHNTGGGGGGHFGAGGIGGEQDVGGFGCQGNFPGRGGKALLQEPHRIYFGGGGGAGHTNNIFEGKTGGSGGGIVLIFGNTLDGQNQKICSNGGSPIVSSSDGGGGGGAGGSAVLFFENILSEPIVEAKGGTGGSITSQTDRCFGPGGGGGGGRILSNNSLTNVFLEGGNPGENIIVSSQCNGPSNEATQGQNGITENISLIVQGTSEILDFEIMAQPEDNLTCINQEAIFSCGILGQNLTFQWQMDIGNGFENISNTNIFEGVDTKILVVSVENFDLNNAQFRCLIFSDCDGELISETAELSIQDNPTADFSCTKISDFEYQFVNLSQFSQTIEWNFGDGNLSNEDAPIHTFDSQGIFTITLTVSNECGSEIASKNLLIGIAPTAQFDVNTSTGCVPTMIEFSDLSTGDSILSWNWSFEGGTPSMSDEQNPTITYENAGLFDVQLIVENPIGFDTLTEEAFIQIEVFPMADFDFEIENLTVSFENTSVGGLEFSWDFGDGNQSNEENPEHTYAGAGNYEVKLTVTSFSCGSTIEQTVNIQPNSVLEDTFSEALSIFPNPVSETLTIELSRVEPEIEVNISNAKGMILRRWEINNSKSKKLDLSDFESGVYWVEIIGKDWKHHEKIVVTK
jgi:PKD repeat protein